ncbi:MAG: dTDP-4-dehydrorhamnose reductase [Pseudomonadota bacterium]
MRMLIFGRNGQVARCLLEEAEGHAEAIALGRADADLSTPGAAAAAIQTHDPDVVVNAAAYTAVDKAEDDAASAQRLNADAPAEMALAAKAAAAQFIHLSTDYVFDGDTDGAYREDDTPNPLGVYGASKLAGEKAVLAAHNEAVIIRTSWVFCEYGGNFVKTMLRLSRERDGLSIVDDQVGGPTPARDIARAILTIAGKKYRGAPGNGVYHYQGAPAISWAAFANKIFEIAGRKTTVTPILTADYPTPAARPLHTVLDCARIERAFGLAPPDWRAELRPVITRLESEAN